MMRSFVKKLAFTMALSMVATTAAPAGSAMAATEFTYAYQKAGLVTELNMEAGDEVNLRFLGVKDWKNYTLEWKSNNPSVATVDEEGIVTAVEDGTTTIELVVGDGSVYTSTPVIVNVGDEAEEVTVALGTSKDNISNTYALDVNETVDLGFYGVPNYSAQTYACVWESDNVEVATVDGKGVITAVAPGSATITFTITNKATDEVFYATAAVTVAEPVVELTYEVKQVSDTKATITFNSNVEYTASDVTFTRSYGEGIEQAWPLKNVEIKDNVITVEPYVAFADGDVYMVKVGAEDAGTEFVTKIGAVDEIRTTFKSMGKDGKAYTNGEEGEEIVVTLETKLYSNGVDVTNVYSTEDVTYTLSAENENVMIDEYAGEVVFSKEKVPVTVIATYVYYDENDTEKTVKTIVPMTSELAPSYKVAGIKAWTIISEDQKEIDWNNVRHSVPAYDEGFQIAVLITDNYGNIVCTVDGLTHKNLDKVQNFSDSRFAAEGYYVSYSSANDEKLLVGEDGSLTTYVAANVPAIIALNNYFKEDNTFVKNLLAPVVTVKETRKINKITVSESSVTLVTDGNYTTKNVEVKVFDQYGNAWDQDATINITSSVANTTGFDESITYVTADGKAVITLDGKNIDCDKNVVTLTFKESETGKTASLKVSLKEPKRYDSNEDGKVDENDAIKVTSYKLKANNVDQYIEKQADGTVKKASVNFYTLSNGYEVGTVSGKQTALVTDKTQLQLTSETASKGAQFLVIYNPDGAIVGSAEADSNGLGVTGVDGEYKVIVANGVATDTVSASALEMKYAKTGTYTVKVLQVSSFNKKNEAVFSTKYSTTFKVENNNKAVKFQKQEKLTSDAGSLEDIVADTLKFTLGGKDWKFTADMVAKVNRVENEKAGRIVITSVVFNVPLNGSDDTAYYTVTVDVNKSVEVPNYFR